MSAPFLILASFAGSFADGLAAYLAAAWLHRRSERRAAREYEQTLCEVFGRAIAEWNANLVHGDDGQPAADNERGRMH